MLLMTLGVIFFFIGTFKKDNRFYKAILGCVLFDVVFWVIYAVEMLVLVKL